MQGPSNGPAIALIERVGVMEVMEGIAAIEMPVETTQSMTLKIEKSARQDFTLVSLTGRVEAQHIEELKRLFELQTDYRNIVVDLKEIRLADRDSVKFLARCEAEGVKLQNCPAYIREWIEREKDKKQQER